MQNFEKLVEMFRQFPGIGPRQARRFAYFLLTRDASYVHLLAELMNEVKKEVKECVCCHRFFSPNLKLKIIDKCNVCVDPNRDKNILMIVSRDADFEVIEKSGTYRGLYFILGGSLPILDKEPEKRIRTKELITFLKNKTKKELVEVILALNANPEGEHTAEFVMSNISPILKERDIKLSHLGRGVSTGTELEYIDSDTLKNALKNRF
jgi:recombination protein RecR